MFAGAAFWFCGADLFIIYSFKNPILDKFVETRKENTAFVSFGSYRCRQMVSEQTAHRE